ncbi:MAG: hypothetical protein SFT81_03660 [Candidatus Caenarcaniphilales bacterium]|nr:hypothetical protein [Candidatus Caenarcaniphilales bacterium]
MTTPVQRLIPSEKAIVGYKQTVKQAASLVHAKGLATDTATKTELLSLERFKTRKQKKNDCEVRVTYRSKNGEITPICRESEKELTTQQQLAVTLTQMKKGNMEMSPELKKLHDEAVARISNQEGLADAKITNVKIAEEMLKSNTGDITKIKQEVGKSADKAVHSLARATGEVKSENFQTHLRSAVESSLDAQYLALLNTQKVEEIAPFVRKVADYDKDQVPAKYKAVYDALPKDDSGSVDLRKLEEIFSKPNEEGYSKLVNSIFESQKELDKLAASPNRNSVNGAIRKVGNPIGKAWKEFRNWHPVSQVMAWISLGIGAVMAFFGLTGIGNNDQPTIVNVNTGRGR